MSELALVEKIKENISKVIVGKEEQTEQLLLALVCGGHVLIEDVPGLGKTTLVTALARSLTQKSSRALVAQSRRPVALMEGPMTKPM